ncbi:hypothetical protein ACFFIS_06790 [Virgibacillus soli]|uniref:Uncharacterized protein n=1 Tax=Paracerasibacillus soli TaxID=480284 RepID=A0ABU5CMS2_9BACI|nr:hypothetical protein [Virgibacillus soli]MDY0407658.1 hypothetical protein [Virgibacillus soli]
MELMEKIDKKEANDFLANYLFGCLEKEGYIKIIFYTNGKIPGFTRNVLKAPLPLVKGTAKKRLWKVNDAIHFLGIYVKGLLEKYKELSKAEFFTQIEMDENVSNGQKFTLFFIIHFEEYMRKKEEIRQNIIAGLPPFQNLVNVTLSDKLKAHSTIYQKEIKSKIDKIFDSFYEDSVKMKKKPNQTLKEVLENEALPKPIEGYYLKAFYQFLDELKGWNVEELGSLKSLVIFDLINIINRRQTEFFDSVGVLKKDFQLEVNKVNNRLVKTVKETHKKEEKIKKLEEEKNELVDNNNSLRKEIEQSQRTIREVRLEREKYIELMHKKQSNIKELKNQLNMVTSAKDRIYKKLFESENICLFTKVRDDSLLHYFTQEQIIYFKDTADLKNNITPRIQSKICFLNLDGIMIRDSFKLEEQFQQKGIIYRIVSGGVNKNIRSIVYYLEGELRYEVKTTD